METIFDKRKKFLQETLEYYRNNPRCLMYNAEEDYFYPVLSGNTAHLSTAGDVIGRLLKPSLAYSLDMEYGEIPLEDIFYEMPGEILELGKDFLQEVCVLHDNSMFWNEKELSEEGEEFVLEIQEKFINNERTLSDNP